MCVRAHKHTHIHTHTHTNTHTHTHKHTHTHTHIHTHTHTHTHTTLAASDHDISNLSDIPCNPDQVCLIVDIVHIDNSHTQQPVIK